MRSNSLRVILFLASLGLAGQLGCNSRASFPYDQGLCGNGQLDNNEPCDLIMPGDYWQFNTDLCHNRPQYAGGPTHCTSSCEPNYEFCIDRADCNAFQSSGCENGKSCYFFSESKATGCAAPGGLLPGDRCDDSSQCLPMSLCHDFPDKGKVCVQICDRNDPHCPGDTPCQTNNDFPPPMGYCEPLEFECDPITDNMCVSPAACYFFENLDPKVQCAMPSENRAVEDQWCGTSDQCMPTLTCVNNTCRVLCNTGTECAPGHTCNESLGFIYYGVCALGKSCDPVTDYGCRGDLACQFSEFSDGNRYCRHPGEVPEGGYCNSDERCAPGLFCSALQSMDGIEVCTPLCSGRKTCLNGNICALESSEFLPGLCVIAQACNPLENDCPSPSFCTIVNDHGDTACVNPGPAQPGEPCDLFRPCVAAQFCDNQGEGNRICRHLCNSINTECPTGGFCTEMSWDPVLPDIGVCR